MKTALAPTVELATPKVEKFINSHLLPFFGELATLKEFYTCSPSTSDVENRLGERWIEGNWGARIVCNGFSVSQMEDLAHLSEVIQVNEADIHGEKDCKIVLSLWLSARVMR